MDLDFSHKGLFIFDASVISDWLEGCCESSDEFGGVLSKLLEHAPCVRAIKLSNNSIHWFTGGEKLKTVTVLDLSFNSLTTLKSSSLPPTLVKLNLFHNQLTCLDALDQFLPFLEELNAGHNALTSDGVGNLPGTLIDLNLNSNELEDLASLSTLRRLVKLDVSQNKLATPAELKVLASLRHLRDLSIRDNPLMQGHFDSQSIIKNVAPWISNLNGVSLLHAEGNNMQRNASAKLREEYFDPGTPRKRSYSAPRTHTKPCVFFTDSAAERRPRSQTKKQSKKGFLVEAQVNELEKMLAEAQKAEQQAFREHELLLDQVKGCKKVIQDQAEQLDVLRKTVSTLKKDEEALRKSALEAERAFEKTHASLLSCRFSN